MKKLTNIELGRKSHEEFKKFKKLPIIIVLDNVRSAYNVGSVFRTADAFPIEAVFLCGITACPPHKEILKTALGATDTVEWSYYKSAIEAVEELRKRNYLVYSVEQTQSSCHLNNFFCNQKYALVFGHEVDGVHQEVINLCDGAIEIPQGGTKHSINIAVSTGVVLWELYKRTL